MDQTCNASKTCKEALSESQFSSPDLHFAICIDMRNMVCFVQRHRLCLAILSTWPSSIWTRLAENWALSSDLGVCQGGISTSTLPDFGLFVSLTCCKNSSPGNLLQKLDLPPLWLHLSCLSLDENPCDRCSLVLHRLAHSSAGEEKGSGTLGVSTWVASETWSLAKIFVQSSPGRQKPYNRTRPPGPANHSAFCRVFPHKYAPTPIIWPRNPFLLRPGLQLSLQLSSHFFKPSSDSAGYPATDLRVTGDVFI